MSTAPPSATDVKLVTESASIECNCADHAAPHHAHAKIIDQDLPPSKSGPGSLRALTGGLPLGEQLKLKKIVSYNSEGKEEKEAAAAAAAAAPGKSASGAGTPLLTNG